MSRGLLFRMITVKLFATFRDKAGINELLVEPGPNTVTELLTVISHNCPSLSDMLAKGGFLVSVNREFVGRDSKVSDGDELAILPPFSGGSNYSGREGV